MVATVDVRLRSSPGNGCANVCGVGGVGGGEVGQAPRTPRATGAGRRSLLMRRRRRLWGPRIRERGVRPSPSCDRPTSMVGGRRRNTCTAASRSAPTGPPAHRSSTAGGGVAHDAARVWMQRSPSVAAARGVTSSGARRAEKLWRLEGRPRDCLPLAQGAGPGLSQIKAPEWGNNP